MNLKQSCIHSSSAQNATPPSQRRPRRFRVALILLLVATCVGAICFLSASIGTKPSRAEEIARELKKEARELGFENALSALTECHTHSIGHDSYFRFQQNYHGLPVYGRTVVYATDQHGDRLSLTHNVQDIPDSLDLTPTITPEQASESICTFLAGSSEGDISVTLSEDALCIYDLDISARLAYILLHGTLELVVDAHSAEVLHCRSVVYNANASYSFSDDSLRVARLDNGDYYLKDEDTDTYVYSANGRTFYDLANSAANPAVLQLITSPDEVFGNGNDSVDTDSIRKAKDFLDCANSIRQFYVDLNGKPVINKTVLIFDDLLGGDSSNSCAWYPELHYILDSPQPVSDNLMEKVGNIILGTTHSANPSQYLDIIAHEYTHVVSSKIVSFSGNNPETGAIKEALSDIFGELIQAEILGIEPDWEIVNRTIYNPDEHGYPITRNDKIVILDSYIFVDPIGTRSDLSHGYSTIISHTAFRMWEGLPNVRNSNISAAQLAELWYRAMLMMPSNADFQDCRTVITLAAEAMGLNPNQLLCITTAFDNADIVSREDSDGYRYVADDTCELQLFGDNMERFYDFTITVERQWDPSDPFSADEFLFTTSFTQEDVCMLSLTEGLYTITLTNDIDTSQTMSMLINVSNDGSDLFHIYTGFRDPSASEVTQPTSSTDIPGTETDPNYELVLWDRSYTDENGTTWMSYYYEYLVLQGTSPGIQKINDFLYLKAHEFMTKRTDEQIQEAYYFPYSDIRYNIVDTVTSSITYWDNGVIAVKISEEYYGGGSQTFLTSYGFVFDEETGEELTLMQLVDMDEPTLLWEMRDLTWEYINNQFGFLVADNARQVLDSFTMEYFDFTISDGQIFLKVNDIYSLVNANFNTITVPTGWYISDLRGSTSNP